MGGSLSSAANHSAIPLPEVPTTSGGAFTESHYRSLQAVAERLFPVAGGGRSGSGADGLTVGPLVDEALSEASPALRRQLTGLLSLLDHPLGLFLLAGRSGPFSRLGPEAAEDVLRGLSLSRFSPRRRAFQALKRLVGFVSLSHHGADGNAAWPSIGYALHPPAAPAVPPTVLNVVALPPDGVAKTEVCVIGSGAGGGVAAAILAAAGREVLVVEKGPLVTEPQFRDDEEAMVPALYMDRGALATADLGMILLAGRCVGGGTVINWCTCFRPPEPLLEEWAREHGLSDLLDPSFARIIRDVEQRLSVTDAHSTHNANNHALLEGLRALGYHHATVARNVSGCAGCDGCWYGCRSGSKQSTLRTYLRDASGHGARLLPGVEIQRIRRQGGRAVEASGRGRDAAGRPTEVTIRAKTFVLAGGAVGTAAILLRSGLSGRHVGRHLHLHPVSPLFGRFPHRIEFWRGVPQSVYSDQFATVDGPFGFKLETAPANPGLSAAALPWTSARGYAAILGTLGHLANIIVLTRDRTEGRVAIDRQGRPVVSYFPNPADRRMLVRGLVEAARVHLAAGAEEALTTHLPLVRVSRAEGQRGFARFAEALAGQSIVPNRQMLYSAHLMGTARMGGRRRDAAVSPEGRLWELGNLYVADGSLFPSASGINPMITIMAMAARVASLLAASPR